jgi:hypothetical protein
MTSFLNASTILSGILILLVLLGVFAFLADRRKRMTATLRRLAQRFGGTVVEGGWFREPRLHLTIAGREGRVEFHTSTNQSEPSYSRVVVDVRGGSPGYLHIVEEDFGQAVMKLLGGQDLDVGDAAFDKDYVIRATPAELARRMFSRERREEGIRIVRRLRKYLDSTFVLSPQSVTVMVRDCLRDEPDILELIEAAERFVPFALPDLAPVGMDVVEVKVGTDGACPVCGTRTAEQSVRCESCRTPHHRECWQYMGRCTTYACNGKRFVA